MSCWSAFYILYKPVGIKLVESIISEPFDQLRRKDSHLGKRGKRDTSTLFYPLS